MEFLSQPFSLYLTVLGLDAGLFLSFIGLRRGVRAWRRPLTDSGRVLDIATGFRFVVIGLAAAGLAAALYWQLTWLLLICIAIGIEETIESSLAIWALRQGQRLSAAKEMPPDAQLSGER